MRLLQADLTDPSSLPATLVGVSIVIDCATARPEESADRVDWEGKKALIQCAQVRPTTLLPAHDHNLRSKITDAKGGAYFNVVPFLR